MDGAYVFIDFDNREARIYHSLKTAKEEGWPDESDWEQRDEDEWHRGMSCVIFKRDLEE